MPVITTIPKEITNFGFIIENINFSIKDTRVLFLPAILSLIVSAKESK